MIAGIDEAGKGCLIGNLVICGASIAEDRQDELKKLGVADSKELSVKQRQALFQKLLKFPGLKFEILEVSPAEIDEAVNSISTNLNWLEADHSAKIIKLLSPKKAVLDCPSPNLSAYKNYVKGKLETDQIQVIAEHKADANYPVVSAASILAKVTRDASLDKIKATIGHDFGSGYPSDPRTSAFLKKYWKSYPDIFRKSWATYKKVAQAN